MADTNLESDLNDQPQRMLLTAKLPGCGCTPVFTGPFRILELSFCPLHAAAPDMLAALKRALQPLRIYGVDQEAISIVLAAIAKATTGGK